MGRVLEPVVGEIQAPGEDVPLPDDASRSPAAAGIGWRACGGRVRHWVSSSGSRRPRGTVRCGSGA